MNIEMTIPKVFGDIAEREYINDCCFGGDEVLNQFKSEIASQMGVNEGTISIYQEDWGWALEFTKDEVFYSLGLNNNYEGGDSTDFSANIEATRKVKKFLFSKNVEAEGETKNFGEVVCNVAKRSGFQVNVV